MLDSEEKEDLKKLVKNIELDAEVLKNDIALLKRFLKERDEIY